MKKSKYDVVARYVKAVIDERSYVGGCGFTEHFLWESIKGLENEAKRCGITLPDVENIEITREDWV